MQDFRPLADVALPVLDSSPCMTEALATPARGHRPELRAFVAEQVVEQEVLNEHRRSGSSTGPGSRKNRSVPIGDRLLRRLGNEFSTDAAVLDVAPLDGVRATAVTETSGPNTGGDPRRKRRSRKWWPVAGAAIGMLAGTVVYSFEPRIYESSTSVLLIPQRVPEDMVRSTVTASLSERLNVISQQILSRTRLERVIQEFSLYERERQRLIMEDVVEQMRGDISISIDASTADSAPRSFRTSFRSPDPRTAMRVTERLASLFVQENLEDRSLLADQTNQFLRGVAEDAQRRLRSSQAELVEWDRRGAGLPRPQDLVAQNEVLGEHYRSVLRKIEEAQMAVNLERRQIGEQFRIIYGARLPEKPASPTLRPYLAWGVFGGLATSFLLMLLSSMWRRRGVGAAQS